MNYKVKEILGKIRNSNTYEILRHSRNYLSADLSVKAIGFISIPIFTRLLTEEEYGIMSVFYAYVPIVLVLLSLNCYNSVSRYYYENKNDFQEFLSTNIILLVSIFLSTSSIYFLFYKKISLFLKLPEPLPLFLIFVSFFNVIYSIYLQKLYPQKKSREIAITSISYGYTTFLVAIIITLLLNEERYLGRVLASLIVGFIFSFFFLYKLGINYRISLDKKYIKYIILYSLPLIPYSLSEQILSQFDRIMINASIGAKAAGLYSIGYNIGIITLLFSTALLASFTPDFFKLMATKDNAKIDRMIAKIFSTLLIFSFVLILFGKNILYLLSDPKFYPGSSVIAPVVVGYIFYAMFNYCSIYIIYSKKTIYLSIVTLVSGICNIFLNYYYIPKYGYIAAAYTTIVSYMLMFLLTWGTVKFLLKLRMTPLSKILKPAFIMFFFMAVYTFLNKFDINILFDFIIKILIILLLALVLFYREIKVISNYI